MIDQDEIDGFPETATCPECQERKLYGVFGWTHDRFGIPWKKVCEDCFDKVEEEICARFEFDESYAGERLDDDY